MEFTERYQYNTKTDFIAIGGFSRVYKAYDRKLGIHSSVESLFVGIAREI
jgi:hypothetical protein